MQILSYEKIVRIQSKGLITIPKRFRLDLGFEENGLIKLIKRNGSLVLQPIRTLSYPVRSYSEDEIQEFFNLDKKESQKLKKKGLL